jgi:hypothetical protein
VFKVIGGRGLPVPLVIILGAAFGVVAGIACYRLVERPLLTVFHGRLRRSPGAGRSAIAWPFLKAKTSS